MFLITNRVTPIILTICIDTEPIIKSHTMGLSSQEYLPLLVFIHSIHLKNLDFIVLQKKSNHYLISPFLLQRKRETPSLPMYYPRIMVSPLMRPSAKKFWIRSCNAPHIMNVRLVYMAI